MSSPSPTHTPSPRRTESPTSSNSNSNDNGYFNTTAVKGNGAASSPASQETLVSPRLDPIIEHVVAEHSRPSRAPSISSISFKSSSRGGPPSPIGQPKARRIRDASPPPASRFQHHVSFDNFGVGGEPTENNTISFTLNVKHKGYQFKRRSRTFMVGIDENDYSDIALQWMLEELVDDGDEIICLRVVEKGAKIISDRNLERRQYQTEARELLRRIQKKNDDNRAISIVLEFAVGKVHATFQKMIQIYEPAMLIVGTRGRSLGGVQGLVSNRNSFSKWCLQYSPIPVVVVRPTEKRIKKKNKRGADPSRQDYARILRESGINEHETNPGSSAVELEISNTPDVEAHAVAAALGLPAAFDPTLKPIHLAGSHALRQVESGTSDVTNISKESPSPDSRSQSPTAVFKSPKSAQLDSPALSDNESSEGEEGSDEEGEFEAVPGHMLLGNGNGKGDGGGGLPLGIEKKQKLHDMEVGEAKALLAPAGRKSSVGSVESSVSGLGEGVT